MAKMSQCGKMKTVIDELYCKTVTDSHNRFTATNYSFSSFLNIHYKSDLLKDFENEDFKPFLTNLLVWENSRIVQDCN